MKLLYGEDPRKMVHIISSHCTYTMYVCVSLVGEWLSKYQISPSQYVLVIVPRGDCMRYITRGPPVEREIQHEA